MKHGRRLTLKQKEFLVTNRLDPKDYLLVKNTSKEFVFVHRETKKLKQFHKD